MHYVSTELSERPNYENIEYVLRYYTILCRNREKALAAVHEYWVPSMRMTAKNALEQGSIATVDYCLRDTVRSIKGQIQAPGHERFR